MSKSNYTFHFRHEQEHKFLCIIDNDGAMSVTNNMEAILEEICERVIIDLLQYEVIYRDTAGIWDGYAVLLDVFYHIGAKTEQGAIDFIITVYNHGKEKP